MFTNISWACYLLHEKVKYSLSSTSIDIQDINHQLGIKKLRKNHTGKITEVHINYYCVDDTIYLDRLLLCRTNLANRSPALGDTVKLITEEDIDDNETEEKRVIEFLELWPYEENKDAEFLKKEAPEDNEYTREIAKIISVSGRVCVLEITNMTYKVNLNQGWTQNYLPRKSDLLYVYCSNRNDFDNDLKIKSFQPIRYKEGQANVYEWSRYRGKISGDIFFDESVCNQRYGPRRGDHVRFHAVECEPTPGSMSCLWRATSVVPLDVINASRSRSVTTTFKQVPDNSDILLDKHDVKISGSTQFPDTHLNEVSTVQLTVHNNANQAVKISKIKMPLQQATAADSERSNQIEWIKTDEHNTVPSKGSVKLTFQLTARNPGREQRLVVVYFENFCIGRMLEVNVVLPMSGDNNNLQSSDIQMNNNLMGRQRLIHKKDTWVIRGPQNIKNRAPKFMYNTLDMFPLPSFLYDIFNKEDYMDNLHSTFPPLSADLKPDNYVVKFQSLLYIEEFSAMQVLERYSMEDIFLTPCGPFLSLTVPGLTEKRPSLVLGDSVILSNPSAPQAPRYEGCIEDVRKSDLILRFDTSFHQNYCGEVYSAEFRMNRTQYRRQHQAVTTAINNLGVDILFPKQITMKNPQINFVLSDDKKSRKKIVIHRPSRQVNPAKGLGQKSECNLEDIVHEAAPRQQVDQAGHRRTEVVPQDCFVTPLHRKQIPGLRIRRDKSKQHDKLPFEFKLAKTEDLSELPPYVNKDARNNNLPTKLKWINSSLNVEQKSGVRRILSGEGRPFPYIIYGPPGTGKTMTVVEAVLQIFVLHTDARILVATPTNSSADLIATRLVKSGKIKVGDLARLNAFQRLDESIPEVVKPFCFVSDGDDLFKAALSKIVVGTCGTVGSLFKLKLRYGHFSHVFIDEAGQLTEPESLIPLGLVHRDNGQIVLAGDPQQLGPVLQSQLACLYGLEQSYLERLSKLPVYLQDRDRFADHGGYDPLLLTRLTRNYRSHTDILTVPSELFYDGDLVPLASQRIVNRFLNSSLLPSKGHPVIFHGVVGDNCREADSPSWFNPQEVWQVCVYTQNLLQEEGVVPEEIGIISPYRKQVSKIREMLRTLDIDGIKVGSVEEFQGQEMPVIILSTTRSTSSTTTSASGLPLHSDIKQGLGFIASPKRMNVAVTRAQSLLILVGNPYLLIQDHNWKQMISHIINLGGYTGCSPPFFEVVNS